VLGPGGPVVPMAGEARLRRRALGFIILLGLVSLFGDMTYEGARSISGPFLAALGASGAAVGIVAGLGELFGYTLRLGSGYLADRTRRYWTVTVAGYLLNLLAVPAMALAGRWEAAGALILAERTGKAFRTPARDAMLSYAARQTGAGWGFGLHEALDQVGAVAGPLVVFGILGAVGDYRVAFGALLVPAAAALGLLILARLLYPRPHELEVEHPHFETASLPRVFWVYLVAVGLVAAGYADFALIGYHLERTAAVPVSTIPVLYALAMAVDAATALIAGYLFDRVGFRVLVGSALIASPFAPLVFGSNPIAAAIGTVLWGIGLGAQESVMRAAVAGMVSPDRRATAYGILNAGYGLMWFAGSAVMGALYDVSLGWLITFSVALELAAVLGFVFAGWGWASRPKGSGQPVR